MITLRSLVLLDAIKHPPQTKPADEKQNIWDRYRVTAWSDAFLFLIFLLTALHLPFSVLYMNDVTSFLVEDKVYVMY